MPWNGVKDRNEDKKLNPAKLTLITKFCKQ